MGHFDDPAMPGRKAFQGTRESLPTCSKQYDASAMENSQPRLRPCHPFDSITRHTIPKGSGEMLPVSPNPRQTLRAYFQLNSCTSEEFHFDCYSSVTLNIASICYSTCERQRDATVLYSSLFVLQCDITSAGICTCSLCDSTNH